MSKKFLGRNINIELDFEFGIIINATYSKISEHSDALPGLSQV